MALGGSPICFRVVNKKSCEMEGNAEAKSRRMQAPFFSVSEVIMEAVSRWRRFARMDRPGRKPC